MTTTSGGFNSEHQEQKTAFKACLSPYCLVNASLLCDLCAVGQHSIFQPLTVMEFENGQEEITALKGSDLALLVIWQTIISSPGRSATTKAGRFLLPERSLSSSCNVIITQKKCSKQGVFMKEKTYTRQPNCISSFFRKENIEKPEITENQDPRAFLLDSLAKFCIELDDFQKVAEKYLDDIEKKEKEGKKSV